MTAPRATVEFYADSVGEWRWRLVAVNGRTVADGSEGYTRRSDAKRAYRRVEALVTAGQVVEVES